jgi:hypothetical protein
MIVFRSGSNSQSAITLLSFPSVVTVARHSRIAFGLWYNYIFSLMGLGDYDPTVANFSDCAGFPCRLQDCVPLGDLVNGFL